MIPRKHRASAYYNHTPVLCACFLAATAASMGVLGAILWGVERVCDGALGGLTTAFNMLGLKAAEEVVLRLSRRNHKYDDDDRYEQHERRLRKLERERQNEQEELERLREEKTASVEALRQQEAKAQALEAVVAKLKEPRSWETQPPAELQHEAKQKLATTSAASTWPWWARQAAARAR